MDPQDVVADAIIDTLSDRFDTKVLKRALTKPVRKELYKRLAEGLLYELLRDGGLSLPPGFGSVLIKEIREKDKKIFNKKTGKMESKRVRGSRISYRPGDLVRQLL
jgi:hypothetical protein